MNDSLATTMRGGLATQEDTTAALAAQVKATVEARFIMALKRPRDFDMARDRILAECKRPRFAESARYRRPVGNKKNEQTNQWEEAFIEGPSIRFAEAAMRSMGNIDVQTMTTFDSPDKRIVQVAVTDLESNTTYARDITLLKTVERRSLKKGQSAIGTRLNSYGDTLYVVLATESEVATKEAAEISKAVRTLGLRHVPGDILDEAMDLCVRTMADSHAKDPEAARKAIVDAFSAMGVKPADLKLYLGQDVGSCSPAQMGELRALYAALKAGEFAWSDVIAPEPEPGDDSTHGVTGLKKRMQKRAAEKAHADKRPPPVMDVKGESVPPAEDIDPGTGEVTPPAPDEPNNGEMSEAEEEAIARAEAEAMREEGK